MEANNMHRLQKIEILKSIRSGKINALDLVAGEDGFFVKIAGYFVQDGIRYTNDQFCALRQSFTRRGVPVEIISAGDGEQVEKFIQQYTKPIYGNQNI